MGKSIKNVAKPALSEGRLFDLVGIQTIKWMQRCEDSSDPEAQKRLLCMAMVHAACLLARLHLSEEVAAQEISKIVNNALYRLHDKPLLGK